MDETPEYPKAIMPAQAKGGRPSKCTPEMIRAILSKIRKGHPYVVACRTSGVHYASFRRWIQKGAQPGAPAMYRKLYEDTIRANAEAEEVLINKWLELAEEEKDWRGIHKFIACRWPQRWAEKRLDGQTQAVVPIRRERNLKDMSLKEIRDLRDGLARVLTIDTEASPDECPRIGIDRSPIGNISRS